MVKCQLFFGLNAERCNGMNLPEQLSPKFRLLEFGGDTAGVSISTTLLDKQKIDNYQLTVHNYQFIFNLILN